MPPCAFPVASVTPRPAGTVSVLLALVVTAAFPCAVRAGSFGLRVPPVVTVEAGDDALLAVQVKRDGCREPVRLTLAGLPATVRVTPEPIVAGNQEVWRGRLTASPGAVEESTTVTVRAQAGSLREEATFELVVTRQRTMPKPATAAVPPQ
ncbi:MAG TPA: hypothetical protein VGF55_34155, partial [Gemmataceae bacterium]